MNQTKKIDALLSANDAREKLEKIKLKRRDAEIKSAEENAKLEQKWSALRSAIVRCAMGGGNHLMYGDAIPFPDKIINAGILIYECGWVGVNVGVQGIDSKIEAISSNARNPAGPLISIIFEETKAQFVDPRAYSNWLEGSIAHYQSKLNTIYNNKSKYELLNFLNSESYRFFGRDGVWNEFAEEFSEIQRILFAYQSKTNMSRCDIVDSLRPDKCMRVTVAKKSKNQLLKGNPYNVFKIVWQQSKGKSSGPDVIFSGGNLAWLASQSGQDFMKKIGLAINSQIRGASSSLTIEFSKVGGASTWLAKIAGKATPATSPKTIEHLMLENNYKTSLSGNKLTIIW